MPGKIDINRYLTLVVQKQHDPESEKRIKQGLELLQPFISAMSLEDEISILEFIENHPDFDSEIGDEARAQVNQLHDRLEQQKTSLLEPNGS